MFNSGEQSGPKGITFLAHLQGSGSPPMIRQNFLLKFMKIFQINDFIFVWSCRSSMFTRTSEKCPGFWLVFPDLDYLVRFQVVVRPGLREPLPEDVLFLHFSPTFSRRILNLIFQTRTRGFTKGGSGELLGSEVQSQKVVDWFVLNRRF